MSRKPVDLLLLVLLWIGVEGVVCSWVTWSVWRSVRYCDHNPCNPAMIWDARRAFAAVIAVQLVQAVGSALLLAAMRTAKNRSNHCAKALLAGTIFAVVGSIAGEIVYRSYPRPAYWSLGDIFVEIFLLAPVVQGICALIGSVVCGMMDWRFRQTA